MPGYRQCFGDEALRNRPETPIEGAREPFFDDDGTERNHREIAGDRPPDPVFGLFPPLLAGAAPNGGRPGIVGKPEGTVNVGIPEGTVNVGIPEGNGIADGKPVAGAAPPSTTDAAGRAEPGVDVATVGGRTPSPRSDPRSPLGDRRGERRWRAVAPPGKRPPATR
ncbi:hypothetical protein OUZ56_032597 [Daphnia magna]|uniref:Uncharacterized protein n=1 Tax=Daphnia magna TaxID=35525 RepID=A0ABR0B9C6_9CRUS|nr:hypothetical protein OUZ56_032597 [Daphnia magna]